MTNLTIPQDVAPGVPGKIVELVPTRSDKEVADDLRKRIVDAHQPLLDVLSEAHKAGFEVQVNCAPGALGKFIIVNLKIAKIY